MDESDEIISGQSQTPTFAVDVKNDPVSESMSTDDPDERLHSSFQSKINLSVIGDETNNQECINDTVETYFANNSVADNLPNETFLENNAEMDGVTDVVPNTNDSLNTSNLAEYSSKPSGTGEDECINGTAETYFLNNSINDDLPHEASLENDAEINEVLDGAPNTDESLITSNLTDSITEPDKETKSDRKTEKISQFPLGRVRDIMKADPDIKIVSAECVFLVAKATEMFLQRLGTEIHAITLRNKKKTLQKKDLDAVISENVAFEFLDGALNN